MTKERLMENDLISRSAFRQQLINRQITTNFFDYKKRDEDGCIIDLLDKAPAADVAPVQHGEWLLKHIGHGYYWECSECHTNPCIYVTRDTKFCPNCGARMDGGADQ